MMLRLLEDCDFSALEDLHLTYYFTSEAETPSPIIPRLLAVLRKNGSLKQVSFRLPVSDTDIIEAAGSLPFLQDLGISSWDFRTPIEASRIIQKRWFPSLRTIWADSFATYRLITSYAVPQALTTIRASIGTADDIRDFLQALRPCIALTTLLIMSSTTDDAPALSLSFEPISQCKGMGNFHMDSSLITPPTDSDLIFISTSWSMLERFTWSTPLLGRATVKGLDGFAVSCRKLRELSVPIVIRSDLTDYSRLHQFCSGVVLYLRDWKVTDTDADSLIDGLTALAPPGWSSGSSKWLSLQGHRGDVWKAVEEKFGDRKRRRGGRRP
ncbi:hypothetical protein FRB96_007100 [Tulasnella sp. 330]|nr:hypothetical protein FRB96_007100 [Tulasnella sp. 330]KAG8880044.1 hypothetical protein FRB97_001195 [Tulasnella sp. 331]KAG8887188.1 hypothetical protein FRB98_000398 [Tulasnella sp. 332]